MSRALEREGIQEVDELVELLASDREARDRFRHSVAMVVTGLFRDPEQFQLLERELLPLVIGTRRQLRVWSAGCADGSELYSVGIVLAQMGVLDSAGFLGSDLLEENLVLAERGVYGDVQLPASLRARMRWEQRDLLSRAAAARQVEPRALPQPRDLSERRRQAAPARAPCGRARARRRAARRAQRARSPTPSGSGWSAWCRTHTGGRDGGGHLTFGWSSRDAVLVAVVAVVFAVLLSAIGDLRGSTRLTEHSVSVLAASGELQNNLGDFSLATRNYVDHPSAPELARWRELEQALPPAAAACRSS